MNKKVFISMLALVISFLVGIYVLKIFFPEEFMMTIQNENLIKVGTYIDNHKWLYYILSGITAFITYWLYCCACSGRKWLKWYECLIIVATIVIIRLCGLYVDTTLRTAISYASFAFLPAIMKGDIKKCGLVYTTHMVCQALSLEIRSLSIYLTNVNFITSLCFGVECYFWLLLFYIIFNYNKKEI